MISDKIIRFHLLGDHFNPKFVVLCLNAGWSRAQLEAAKTGMAESQMNISQADLLEVLLPVASKREQSRIVARVEDLRRLCADLRERLRGRQACQTRFAEAVVEKATAIAPLAARTDVPAAVA